MKWALDEGVPDSVGVVLKKAGHKVIYLNKTIPRSSTDIFVSDYALLNGAILVALDADMRQIAKGLGIGRGRFKRLNLLKLSCREPMAATRVQAALTLIEHEWHVSASNGDEGRRIFIEIGDSVIRSNR